MSEARVAVVQIPPVFFDRVATLERAIEQVDTAADAGARLIAFPEAFVSGYPEWIWRLAPANYDVAAPIWERFVAGCVDLQRDGLGPLRAAARRRGVTIALGINERDGEFSRSTIYNSLVIIGPDGEIQLRHRKLVPTNPERMVWGAGDGVGLETVATPLGRVGGLICWENYMPLARFALFADGVQIYLAPTWDEGDVWLASMRHIAAEGRCWVLGCGNSSEPRTSPPTCPAAPSCTRIRPSGSTRAIR